MFSQFQPDVDFASQASNMVLPAFPANYLDQFTSREFVFWI